MKGKTKWLWVLAGLLFIGGLLAWYVLDRYTPGQYDTLATCLAQKGVVFYGAFWCPHCQEQKRLFGKSAKLLPYKECSTADGRGQFAECKEKDIQSYPTWIFPDGSREVRTLTPTELSAKSGCELVPSAN